MTLIGFNRLIDPYALYGGPIIEGVNANKPAFSSHAYMAKAIAVQEMMPSTIFLGSSRGERGMDPIHPALDGEKKYNLSLSGSSIYEALRYFQHTHAITPLKQVVLGLGLRQFKHADQVSPTFTEERLSVSVEGAAQNKNWLSADLAVIASLDSIAASIKTLWKQDETPELLLHGEYNPQRLIEDMTNHRADFLSNEKSYINSSYKDFSFTDNKGGDSTLNHYKKLLATAYRDNIDLKIFIYPCHARQWEALSVAGLWSEWEQWKRQLVALNESVAAGQGKSPFALWDFSGYNHYTTEVVPALGDSETAMQWYWESSHYKKELGDLVLDQIFDYHSSERKVADGFGVKLASENISDHLEKIRQDRQRWRASHPNDVSEIEALKKTKHKPLDPRDRLPTD
ncbi:MAG: hypothetical protein HOH97_01550 [Thiotrichales bacterium]|nr:hypothetical protein [Thiotrichales bacterium]MBT3751880.1 hypothetical protein [Thiotrichales bacterium]MBT4261064.1 hypothetical protein [Thiotrichales bacterium]MBT5290872.1 hypothetical protein [Thiotrichales bacterium]MBT5419109.1 hypothetical protein [Thiotrichales bacterium]